MSGTNYKTGDTDYKNRVIEGLGRDVGDSVTMLSSCWTAQNESTLLVDKGEITMHFLVILCS